MKVSTTDRLPYIFFLPFCLVVIKNSIEVFFENNFAGDPFNFLNAIKNSCSPVSLIFNPKNEFFVVAFREILWIFVAFFSKHCKLRKNIYVLL